jgi:hypothetical protein
MQTPLSQLLAEFVNTARRQEAENRAYSFANLLERYDRLTALERNALARYGNSFTVGAESGRIQTSVPNFTQLDHLPEGSH